MSGLLANPEQFQEGWNLEPLQVTVLKHLFA
jgi:hypothetical protein